MSLEIHIPELGIELDARDVADHIVQTMGDYWAGQLEAGQRADGGGGLPRNRQGQPFGRGKGTIAKRWETTSARGGTQRAAGSTAPFQDGGYRFAVQAGRKKGIDLVDLGGRAGQVLEEAIDEAIGEAFR
jgi:hypothetical protein